METTSKQLVRRCPRLGGPVDFFYCLTCERQRHPCLKIIDCWWETFDVQRYLQENLTSEVLQQFNSRKPEPKISQIIKVVARTKKHLPGS